MADNVFLPFEPPRPTIAPIPRAIPVTVLSASSSVQVPQTTAAQADLESDSETWNMYLDEVKEEDNRTTDAWKADANSFVTFVSHTY